MGRLTTSGKLIARRDGRGIRNPGRSEELSRGLCNEEYRPDGRSINP